MVPLRQARSSYRRALFVYFLAIVGPTLILLYLGLQSVERQREAIANLTVSNIRLSGERLAAELERRIWHLAEACLQDKELAGLRLAPDDVNTPRAAQHVRKLLAGVRERYPIAHHFFILQGNAVRFPLLRTPLPQRVDAYLADENPQVRQRFLALFAEGEHQELHQQRPDLALTVYRRSYELPVSDSLKALALARVARCLQKVNQVAAAEQAYRLLGQQYGDLYDPFHRPYGLIAALELNDLPKTPGQPSPQSLWEIYRDLATGRWELSAEQIDYFLPTLGDRLEASRVQETDYLRHLKLARALQEGFRHHGPLRANQVYTYAFTHGGTSYQTFYILHLTERGRETLIGFALDLNWIRSRLLLQLRRELGVDEGVDVVLKTADREIEPEAVPEERIAFRTLFPFWEVSVARALDLARETSARRQMLVFAGATVLILGVLGLGVFFLIRDVSREMQLGRLRTDFVSGVSHELKTPLTLIRLYGELLIYGKNFTEEDRKSYYQIITHESERLTHLIEKVLDFSRIERGQKQYHLREGDLAPVIARTVEVYGQHLKRRGFSVETDLATHVPLVEFDPDAISQAVLNLMDNAAKYSGESKFIGVRLRAEEGRVVFEVEDHGIGIPQSEREKIFQQFYRARKDTGKGGYGLGLFLVQHIMEAHGGTIELESEVGRGSRFRLIFPVRTARTENVTTDERE